MVKKVYLHGPLAEKYGKEPFVFKADNFRQMMNGLRVFCPGIQTELRQYTQVCVFKKRGSEVQCVPTEEIGLNFGAWDEIHINVSVTAAGAETFATWAASYFEGSAIVYAAAYVVYSIALSYVLSSVIQGMQDTITTEKAKSENKSALFNGPENRVRQGARAQLNYGRFRVGSVTLNQQMTGVRQQVTANDNLSIAINSTGSVNVFANDLFKVSPVANTFTVNGVTTNAGTPYTTAGCTIGLTTAGVLSVTSTSTASTFQVVVVSTDTGGSATQVVNVSVTAPQEQYYGRGGSPVGRGSSGGPGGDGGRGH